VRAGDEISGLYDPLIAKLIVHDTSRERARLRMLRALEEFAIDGPTTLLGFHRALLASPCFVEGGTCAGIVESEMLARRAEELTTPIAAEATATTSARREQVVEVELEGRRHEVRVVTPEPPWIELGRRHRERKKGLHGGEDGHVRSPMQGTVLSVQVADGDEIASGDLICVVEAMKMENEIHSHRDGVVAEIAVAPGQQVSQDEVICRAALHARHQ